MTKPVSVPLATTAYIPSLDGWRAIAILIVFASHAGLGQIVPGGLGVTIFFFLSGYLITTLLIQEHERNGEIALRHFFLRRVFRLMPPLVVTLMLAYGLTYAGVTKGYVSWTGFLAQLLYFANYYYLFFDFESSVPAGTVIFWSLAVEEHFYFVFPFIFYALFHIKNEITLKRVLIAVCVAIFLWRCALVVLYDSPANRTYYATDTRIDSIIFGCLLALMKNPINGLSTPKRLEARELLVLFLATSALVLTLLIRNPVFRETLRYSIQGVALAPLFYYSICRHQSRLFSVLNTSVVRKVGQYSYSIYLIHYIVLENVNIFESSALADVFVSIVLIMLFAVLIDMLVDKPFSGLRKKFR